MDVSYTSANSKCYTYTSTVAMQNLCGSCIPSKKPQHQTTASLPTIHSTSSIASRSGAVVTGPNILIIGGGVAGLACGVKLLEYGIDNVTILEAQNRIGGRIHTIPFADNNVDLGAQWVHGEKDNIVYEMVKLKELLESAGDTYVSFQCIRSNGEIVNDNLVQKLKDMLTDIFINRRSEMSNFDGTFGEYLKINFFEALKDTRFDELDPEIANEFFVNFKKMESSESSLGLEEISARGFLEYWDCDGDYMLGWREKGYQEFLRVLTKAKYGIESPLGVLTKKIVFGARVNLIEWDREDGNVRVTCEDMEQSYHADNVVVTVSLGVLKQYGNTLFQPALPEQKLRAIQSLGYGDVFKVFIEFPSKFWPAKWTGFTTLWREEDLQELESQDLTWLQEIYGFYVVSSQPRVLQAWAVGKAVLILETLPASELRTHVMDLLRRFLPTWNIPEPVSIIGSSWSTNRDFCGAYSFRTLQAENAGTGASTLALPLNTTLNVPISSASESDMSLSSLRKEPHVKPTRLTIKPTVLFAGEATSTHYFSTVHGAVESGFREADRLAGYYEYET